MPIKVSLLMDLNSGNQEERNQMFEKFKSDTILVSMSNVEMVLDSTSDYGIFNNSADF